MISPCTRPSPLFLLLALLAFTGCAASRPADLTPAPPPVPANAPVDAPAAVPAETYAAPGLESTRNEARLRTEVEQWEGTPHRLGGTNRDGIDCSAFVMMLYDRVFTIDLPRTTEAQAQVGEPVRQEELRPGDLVFFLPPKARHVGVYLSGGEFAHASASRGVMVSRLEEAYWQNAYWTARRVLPAATDPRWAQDHVQDRFPALRPAEPPRERPAEPPARPRSRAGW